MLLNKRVSGLQHLEKKEHNPAITRFSLYPALGEASRVERYDLRFSRLSEKVEEGAIGKRISGSFAVAAAAAAAVGGSCARRST